jgi:hypothetical protein
MSMRTLKGSSTQEKRTGWDSVLLMELPQIGIICRGRERLAIIVQGIVANIQIVQYGDAFELCDFVG